MSSLNRIKLKAKKFYINIFLVLIILLTSFFQPNIISIDDNNNTRLWKSLKLSDSVNEFWNFTTGADVGSTPALGDVNGDGKLEIVIGC